MFAAISLAIHKILYSDFFSFSYVTQITCSIFTYGVCIFFFLSFSRSYRSVAERFTVQSCVLLVLTRSTLIESEWETTWWYVPHGVNSSHNPCIIPWKYRACSPASFWQTRPRTRLTLARSMGVFLDLAVDFLPSFLTYFTRVCAIIWYSITWKFGELLSTWLDSQPWELLEGRKKKERKSLKKKKLSGGRKKKEKLRLKDLKPVIKFFLDPAMNFLSLFLTFFTRVYAIIW